MHTYIIWKTTNEEYEFPFQGFHSSGCVEQELPNHQMSFSVRDVWIVIKLHFTLHTMTHYAGSMEIAELKEVCLVGSAPIISSALYFS